MPDTAAAVGMTATFGAAARAVATTNGLLNDPFAEQLVRAAGVDYFVKAITDERFSADAGDDPVMTRLMNLCAAHTRFSDEFLAAAGRAGIRQVVILASGLDTRPYRLWWPRGTTVYEVDRSEVLDFKSEVLRDLGAALSANRRAIGADLSQDWLAALLRVGFDAARPTVWLAEELLVGYLTPDAQNRLLADVTAVSAPGSRLATDHMPIWTPLQLDADRAFVDAWRRHGLDVDLASLTYPGQYYYVPDYLNAHGWETLQRSAYEVLDVDLSRPRGGDPVFFPEYLTATRV